MILAFMFVVIVIGVCAVAHVTTAELERRWHSFYVEANIKRLERECGMREPLQVTIDKTGTICGDAAEIETLIFEQRAQDYMEKNRRKWSLR